MARFLDPAALTDVVFGARWVISAEAAWLQLALDQVLVEAGQLDAAGARSVAIRLIRDRCDGAAPEVLAAALDSLMGDLEAAV